MANVKSIYGNILTPPNDHTHANKELLDSITNETVLLWNSKADAVHNEGFIGGLNAALLSTGGAAVGSGAKASKGFAGGKNASAAEGAAIGSEANTSHGVAAGRNAKTMHGVALGDGAQTVDAEGKPITAVQLGAGTNNNPNTFQVFSYQMLDLFGHIPAERLPESGAFYHYDTYPRQIGEWIDGTPVWRYGFNKNLSADDITWSDKAYAAFAPLVLSPTVTYVPFNKDSSVFCIGGRAWLKQTDPCWVDDPACTGPSAGAAFEFFDIPNISLYTGIYGYIDFVTEEDNINFAYFN